MDFLSNTFAFSKDSEGSLPNFYSANVEITELVQSEYRCEPIFVCEKTTSLCEVKEICQSDVEINQEDTKINKNKDSEIDQTFENAKVYEAIKDIDMAICCYDACAEKGNLYAVGWLAKYYDDQKNLKAAIKYYEILAKNQDSYSALKCAKYYKSIDPKNAKMHYKNVLEIVEDSIENMDEEEDDEEYIAEATDILIKCYYYLALYYSINIEESSANYRKMRKFGNYMESLEEIKTPKAYRKMGDLCKHYGGTALCQIEYYRQAVELGDVKSLIKIGDIHKENKEYDTMIECYELAIKQKNSEGFKKLAEYYEEIGDTKNMIKNLESSIAGSNVSAMTKLANHYAQNKQFEDAELYYIMAANLGDITAMNNLGVYYEKIAPVLDTKAAIEYYKKACDGGSVVAHHNLATCYDSENAKTTVTFTQLATIKRLYQTVIDMGTKIIDYEDIVSDSMHKLGLIYCEHDDIDMGKYFLEEAISKGNVSALDSMSNFYKKYNPNPALSTQFRKAYFDKIILDKFH